MKLTPSSDPLGHALLEERLEKIQELFLDEGAFEWADFSLREDRANSFIVCGLGSSAAHARYLSYLLQYFTDFSATFLPVSAVAALTYVAEGTVLVVVSQGLSPNAWLALEKRNLFQDTIVVTSVSEANMRNYKSAAFCEQYSSLRSEGVHILRFPLEAEYEVLIRVVGPLLGYYACLLLVKRLAPEVSLELEPRKVHRILMETESRIAPMLASAYDELRDGVQIVTSFPLSELGTNLCFKILEGLFCPFPSLWNYMDVAHGLLQKNAIAPQPVWILESENDPGEIVDAVTDAFERVGCSPRRIASSLPNHLSVLEFEMLFNHLVIGLIKREGIDQRNWPGKGVDGELYTLGQTSE